MDAVYNDLLNQGYKENKGFISGIGHFAFLIMLYMSVCY